MVWIESITATRGASGRSSEATMSRTDVAATSWTGASARAKPLGAQPHLVDRLFAGDVGTGRVLFGQRGRHLQQQGRLADAGIAADQQRGADDQPAAADAIEFADAALEARRLRGLSR